MRQTGRVPELIVSPPMRRKLSLLAVPVLLVSLAACTGDEAPEASPTPGASTADGPQATCPEPGELSDGVEVTGDEGAKPTVAFESPLEVDETQRTVVSEGDGDEVEPGDVVNIAVSIYDAATGDEVAATGYDGTAATQLTVDEGLWVPGLVSAVTCVPVGSRTVTVATADDMRPQGATGADAEAATSVVIVADVQSVVPTRADGEDQPAVEGLPTVELDDDGRPTVTIPDAEAPDELQIATLKEGDGEVVPDPANVTVQYQGVNWRTGEVFDESWGRGAPSPFSTEQVVPGFAKAMIGQTVGSQVLVVIPPSEGYGEAGQPSAGIEGTDTLVFVIDILAVS